MFNVTVLTLMFGVPTAWLITMHQFPGHRILKWALLLPLAVPAYVGAYAFVDFWEYAGPAQTGLRSMFGWETGRDYWFPEVRSRGAASLVLSLSLYPYVYLLCRQAFQQQSARTLDVARALGCNPWQSFWRVGIPLARPAIVAGLAIVMMETLSDFGAVEYFAVQTLTTGIFSVWLESRNAGGAAQLASLVLTLVLVLLAIEKFSRGNRRHTQTGRTDAAAFSGAIKFGWLASFVCTVPVLLGFIMPVTIFIGHAFGNLPSLADPVLLKAILRTVYVAGIATLVAISIGLLVTSWAKLSASRFLRALTPITMIGYAVPGAVLGLGVLIPMAKLDNFIADLVETATGFDIGLLFTGTAGAIIFAYTVRFFALSIGGLDSAYSRISPSLGAAARSLGAKPVTVFGAIYAPLIKGSVLSAALLLFVDCVKELPATLLLRPVGYDTLSTHVYVAAGLEDLTAASVGSLFIVAVSTIAVLILARTNR